MEKEPVINLKIPEVPPPSMADRINQALKEYGIVTLFLFVLLLYLNYFASVNDKLNELNRSVGRLEGKIEVLQAKAAP
ncbi:MAG TPA: hypothetical protein VEP90_23620 [Methylomirabilota bacterium]|jgi:hypothetical protein|nr:hypothetical protein [Methylomirabilota bacterium]